LSLHEPTCHIRFFSVDPGTPEEREAFERACLLEKLSLHEPTCHIRFFSVDPGTPEEREAFERAYAHGRKADYHDKFVIEEEGAITIDIKPVGKVLNGQEFTTKVQVLAQKEPKIFLFRGLYNSIGISKILNYFQTLWLGRRKVTV